MDKARRRINCIVCKKEILINKYAQKPVRFHTMCILNNTNSLDILKQYEFSTTKSKAEANIHCQYCGYEIHNAQLLYNILEMHYECLYTLTTKNPNMRKNFHKFINYQ
jgi:ribosomal protein S27E